MSINIHETALILPGVVFEGSAVVEAGCIIGSFQGEGTPPKTVIGDGAHIRSHTVLYAGTSVGKNFSTGNKANIREHTVIGDDVSVGTMAVVEHHVVLEDGVRLHSQSFVPEFCVLEAGAWLGPNAVLTNTRYPLSRNAKENPEPVRLCKGAIVGANATVLPGITVGARALVGAGSVVTRDVPPGTVVAGNPATYRNDTDELPYG